MLRFVFVALSMLPRTKGWTSIIRSMSRVSPCRIRGVAADDTSVIGTFTGSAGSTRGIGTPFIIGVAGGTASGKSTVVDCIVKELNEPGVAVLPQDCYYRSLSAEDHARACSNDYNFDHPSAFDFPRILATLQAIRSGATTITVPTYDYVTHAVKPPEFDRVIIAPQVIIFEGILAFHDPAVRSLFDMKVSAWIVTGAIVLYV